MMRLLLFREQSVTKPLCRRPNGNKESKSQKSLFPVPFSSPATEGAGVHFLQDWQCVRRAFPDRPHVAPVACFVISAGGRSLP
jgi:hypothetical protein